MQIINLIHKITRKIGFDFRRYSADYFPELKRAKVIENQNINLVLDVGASEGFYGKELREVKYRGRIISFEPSHQLLVHPFEFPVLHTEACHQSAQLNGQRQD